MGRSAAERKQEQRIRMEEAINTKDEREWDEATCLWALQRSTWKDGAVGEAAWRQLGRLRGFGEYGDRQRPLV
jgi:hypothetical protein